MGVLIDLLEVADNDRKRRREQINQSFTPWTQDPVRIAALLRWLATTDEAPRTIPALADFIENAERWAGQYEALTLWESL